MRLNSVKLSGFKSFADAVTLELPGQLVGVVGPNGCGKSNIMDAVRWVLGESKASQLRGESMQDVIFNGTSQRKPASRTLVELHFDNSDQRAGGAFGRFAEIAVRRVLTRDGASTYWINGQRVRRRDVHDVFLGTGLGPRAYAIIGQGTIGRIIESRPEELRLFLEEAAGVSKYKERRRETQNRLSDTRENLSRVEDIGRELQDSLARLERQAGVADTYRKLQQAVAQAQDRLWFSRRAQAATERAQLQAQLDETELQLQDVVAQLREQEAALAAMRQAHHDAGDAVSQTQSRLYEASAEVGQLQAQIRHVAEGRQRVQEQLTQLQQQQDAWRQRRRTAEAGQQDLRRRQQALEEEQQAHALRLAEGAERLAEAEQALERARAAARQAQAEAARYAQQRQVKAAGQRALAEQLQQLQARRERVQAAQAQLPAADDARLQALHAQLQAATEEESGARRELQRLQAQVQELEQARAGVQQAAQRESVRRTDLAARLQALQELQHKLQSREALAPWRQRHALDRQQPLWKQLRVQPGWERALEAALRDRLDALPASSAAQVLALADDPPPGRQTLYLQAAPQRDPEPGPLPRLLDKLVLHDAARHALLADWLAGCHVAPALDVALQQRSRLQAGEVIYTPAGHAVRAASISFHADDSEQAGLLARAAEIADVDRQLRAQQQLHEQAVQELEAVEHAVADCARELGQCRRRHDALRSSAHGLQVEHLRCAQQIQQATQQREQIAADLSELASADADLQQRQGRVKQELDALQGSEQAAKECAHRCEQAEDEARRQAQAMREAHDGQRSRRQELDFQQRSLQAEVAELQRVLATAAEQESGLQARHGQAQDELVRLGEAPAEAGLQQALARKADSEQALASARSRYDDASARLRQADEQRLVLQQRQEPLRARLTELRLQEQAAALHMQDAEQRLADAGADWQALAAAIGDAPPLDAARLEADIARMQRKIEGLGAVNLAALDELEAQRQRKAFLDAQLADLTQAMQTLEAAIRKIDADTRELLGATFDAVNVHFGRMFPELFGGGHAQLVMTGQEILDAGVQVMAQPPGKKNQTIHLLSGGEKALTAIALVFAIFQLNPAPFCLLDEVDAPLDDANTVRFAQLVRKMSEQGTQFLFISHNKIAMEMAEQLIGVTMQEQGVSRVVAVDMQGAVRMTEAA
ncbi:MAG: chromosome segregation protein SMC [Ottowia sp.]|nr:chromosome segregation protein SMC [Ottowia sp.]